MKRLLIYAAVLLGVIACTAEPIELDSEILEPLTVSAGFDDQGSKVRLDGTKTLWEENDRIAIYDGKALREFVLVSGAGTKSGNFSGEVAATATSLTAVYPYSAATLESGILNMVIPTEQTANAHGADPNAFVMRASASKGSPLNFRNMVGLLRFTVPAGVTELQLMPGGHDVVKVNLPGTAGTYDAALLPGTYDGLTVLSKASGKWYLKHTDNDIKVTRSHISKLGSLPLENEVIPISDASGMAAFLKAATASNTGNYILLNDIALPSNAVTATGFGGSLNGLGHTVSGISKPLFATCNGSVSNLALAGSIKTTTLETAALAVRSYSSISNVTSKVAVSVTASAAVSDPIVLGSIAAYAFGPIENCSNEAAVGFAGSSSVKAVAIGGIAGYSEAALTGCSNTGAVSLSAKYGSGMTALGAIASSASNLGGIVGAASAGFSATECVNGGAVTYVNDAINSATEMYQRSQIGGVAGSPYGNITSCRNTGSISVTATTTDGSAYSANNYIFDVGGISGGSFHETANYQDFNDHTSITDCANDGDIDIHLDASKSNSPIGGIVGWPNGEKSGLSNVVSGCTNSGSLTMAGQGKVRVGGVMGGTGSLDHCSNSGRIYIASANSGSQAAGIAAFHSQDHALYACTNTGDVVSKVTLFGLGGLIGCHGGVDLTSSAACKVLCSISSDASDRSGVGMVLGTYNKETTKNVVLGTEAEPIEVRGMVTVAGKGVTLNTSNFTDFLTGTSYASSTHVVYAYCDTEAPASLYYAEGTVKYTDGKPASGVTVSDGFRVAVTDAQGKYTLTTSEDTWYIYVSLPSDAAVTKKSDGRPDFFTRYEYPSTQYDFTLTRQAVENEFAIFAMADPQAHYQKRNPQTIADTDRFLAEAVPAINTQIAAQNVPCYGITLGDIVYSEGSRNSNSGMSTMRSHFSKVNMPVFQTMGNHDYTFFYNSSNPIKTDATSSTVYLKAQRKFEDAFGPVNYSFNRGKVHFVCMRDIIFDSTTDASSYHGGFTDDQYTWLQKDLANVPKSNMVVLCVHIPIRGITSNEHVGDVLTLMKAYTRAKVFSGHTHYKRYQANINSTGISEHIHAAVCGQWWWSNIEGDGAPNGYTVYRFSGTSMVDEYFIGQNTHMNTRDYQMRIYRGNLKTGGSYAYFQWPHDSKKLMINVFNGDSRWTVKVYENGTLSGTASLVSYSRQTYDSVTSGTTYTVPATSSQDWWAIGYHIGVKGRGRTGTSYYTSMFHMYTYTLKNENASVRVEATDPYGRVYSCEDVISTDCWYPDYIKLGNVN